MRLQRIGPNVLNRPLSEVPPILPTTPLGLTQENPIGGPITGAAVVSAINKGFHQHRSNAIARLPVIRQASERLAQHV